MQLITKPIPIPYITYGVNMIMILYWYIVIPFFKDVIALGTSPIVSFLAVIGSFNVALWAFDYYKLTITNW